MTLSTLPTDATYKLILILGLIMIVASLFNLEKANGKVNYFEYRLDSMKNESKKLDFKFKLNIKKIKSSKLLLPLLVKADTFKKLAVLKELQREKLDDYLTYCNYQLNQSKSDLINYSIIAVIGMILVRIGYGRWRNQQEIQDKILQKQYEILDLEFQSKLNPSKPDFSKYRKH
ncbi:hypothetical protein [Pedobacter agri]|uniref:hypothetical protein n=1 Tax=Pedobacter agri TaxID=454586 RepID=UPI0029315189|nr:hypothetical protein [Pedobacter agri]